MNPLDTYSLENVLRVFIALVFVLSGVIAVLYSVWGGFLLIMSGGNEEKVKPAVNHIRHAAIGLLFLLITLFVVPRIISFFGLPYADIFEPTRIFQTMSELSSNIFEPQAANSIQTTPNSTDTLPSDFSDL